MSSIQNISPVSAKHSEIRFSDLDAKNKAKIIGIRVGAIATALIGTAASAAALWYLFTAFPIVGVAAIIFGALKVAGVVAGGATLAAVTGPIVKKLGQLEDTIRQEDATAKALRFKERVTIN